MTMNRHAALMDTVASNIDTRLFQFFQKIREGKPDLGEALSIARASGRLVYGDAVCEGKILDAVEFACLASEHDRQVRRGREDMRERIARHNRKVDDLKHFSAELKRDCSRLRIRRGDEDFVDDRERLEAIIEGMDKVVADAKEFFDEQKELFKGNTPATPNRRNVFEQAFVRDIRYVWRDITGTDAGIARACVVRFAAAVWSVFDFDATRKTKPARERELYSWLSERFDNVR